MLISDTKKFIFIHNPKCAGTSLRKLLKPYDSHNNTFWNRGNIEGIEHIVDKAHIPLGDILKTNYNNYFTTQKEDYFIFGFVRNPYSRAYSAYKELKKQFKETEELSFLQYLQQLNSVNTRYDFKYVHAMPQHLFFYHQKKCYADFIGKIENLDQDLQRVCALIDIKYYKLNVVNSSSSDDKIEFSDLFSSKEIQIINELYFNDFLYFGYEMLGEIPHKAPDHELKNPLTLEPSALDSPLASYHQKLRSIQNHSKTQEDQIIKQQDTIKSQEDQIIKQQDNIKSQEDQIIKQQDTIKYQEDQITKQQDTIKSQEDQITKQQDTIKSQADKFSKHQDTLKYHKKQLDTQLSKIREQYYQIAPLKRALKKKIVTYHKRSLFFYSVIVILLLVVIFLLK